MLDLIVIVVGDEILEARRQEANAAFVAREAARLGVRLREIRVVSDEPGSLVQALQECRRPNREVVITGGLGPTRDDRTRSEVAQAFGAELILDPRARQAVEQAYAQRNRALDVMSLTQAWLPVGADMIPNPLGTAPGIRMVHESFGVSALPGVPREMRAMWHESIAPLLTEAGALPGDVRVFTFGLGESEQESRMKTLDLPGVEFCSLPGPWGVELRCLVREGEHRPERAQAAMEQVAGVLGNAVVTPWGSHVGQALWAALRARNEGLFLAESCTAGMAASLFADTPGASAVLHGAVVAYANAVKQQLLGVKPETLQSFGAVSEPTAREMAQGAYALAGNQGLSLSITGIAGPDGGTPEKPVGTIWMAACWQGVTYTRTLVLSGGEREVIRQRSAWSLLGFGWQVVTGQVG